ncbi:hypothetical protein [Ruminococcus albus]|uniref:hypothetical protein n=1 Tax=Ruminococcus albus TaxID=1264 RepID=UPI000316E8A3|nr:hypothetical protein [Ruminococcus albus]MCC3350057.1 hypothetical protein [Ruminococcus albus 8]
MKTKLPILKTDPDFQSLIPPLSRQAYEELELNIVCNGCREPIKVWGDYIIDGHKRYKICHEYEIEFNTEEILLKSREDAISWICADLLHNHELPENYQHYLIGRKYLAERTVGIMNITGTNQYTLDSSGRKPHSGVTATKIGIEFHISHSTVSKYLQYAKAIDRLKAEFPDFGRKILYEEIKVSQDNIILLAKKQEDEIKRIIANSAENGKVTTSDIEGRADHIEKAVIPVAAKATVKDMPAFDPDAYVSSLTLTIPSWISSIKRTAANSDIKTLSAKARCDLVKVLNDLISISTTIKNILEEN